MCFVFILIPEALLHQMREFKGTLVRIGAKNEHPPGAKNGRWLLQLLENPRNASTTFRDFRVSEGIRSLPFLSIHSCSCDTVDGNNIWTLVFFKFLRFRDLLCKLFWKSSKLYWNFQISFDKFQNNLFFWFFWNFKKTSVQTLFPSTVTSVKATDSLQNACGPLPRSVGLF